MCKLNEWIKFKINNQQKIGKIIDILRGGNNKIIIYTVQSGDKVFNVIPDDIKSKKQRVNQQNTTSIFYC
jgi:DNA-binding HxlR family transcriptional regulator